MNKKLLTILFSVSIILTGCGNDKASLSKDTTSTSEVSTVNPEKTKTLAHVQPGQKEFEIVASFEDQTPYSLLGNEGLKVDFTDYGDMGYFVTGINGVIGDDDHYWAFYVNGDYGMEASNKLKLHKGDIVVWKYEKVEDLSS